MEDHNWRLIDELTFIRNLGQFRGGHPSSPGERIALLAGYLESLKRRAPDNGLDLEACRAIALEQIAIEEQLLARMRPA